MSGIPAHSRFGCYIGNIDRSVTIDMLKQVFCQCGTIIDCSLNGRDGDPYRFGFIDFATEDDRARALKYNGFTLVGRKLKVGISKGNVNKPEGFSTGNPGGVSSPGHASDRMRQGPNHLGGRGGADGEEGGAMSGGLTTQQQIEARLLLQFLQEGKMDPRQLSPQQQQLLIASLGQGNTSPGPSSNSNNISSGVNPMLAGSGHPGMMQPQPTPMGNPMMPMMNPMMAQGNYGGPNMMMPPQQQQQQPWNGGMAPNSSASMYPSMGPRQVTPPMQPQPQQQQQQQQHQAPYGASGVPVLGAASAGVNAPPSGETLRLREKQREQFFDVVRKDTEKYERKVQEKKAQVAAGGAAERSESTASDDDDKPAKKSKKEKNA